MMISGDVPDGSEDCVLVGVHFRGMVFEIRSIGDDYRFVCRQMIESRERRSDSELVGHEPQTITGPDWSSSGGMLPPKAHTAYLLGARDSYLATTGNGAWVACASEPKHRPGSPPVRYLDPSGEIVPVPWPPGDWTFRMVSQDEAGGFGSAGECVVCNAVSWRAGTHSGQAGERVVCAKCGYSDGSMTVVVRTSLSGGQR